MRVLFLIIVSLFLSCSSSKKAVKVLSGLPKEVPTMTNRQLTDAYVRTSDSLLDVINQQNKIIASMLIPDPTMFEMRNGVLVFKSRVMFDTVQVAGYLLVGRDTAFHVELPLDSLKFKQ